MTATTRRRTQQRIRIIKIQWLIILALVVALIISIATRPNAVEYTAPAALSSEEPVVSAEVEETPEATDELIELGEFKTTAYCTCVKCCGIWSSEHPSRVGTDYVQKTASGTIPTEGRTIAVDTDVIPFGTTVIIDGHEYIAEDTGSAIEGNEIDIYFASHEAACEYGVQTKTIYIKGE